MTTTRQDSGADRHRTISARSPSARIVALLAVLAAGLAVLGCGPAARTGGSALDNVVVSISRTQQVDEATVRVALSRAATTEDEQLRLARQWQAELPPQSVPNLSQTFDEVASYLRQQVASATCGALFDIAVTGEVPSGQQFVYGYLTGIALDQLPAGELLELQQTFDELWLDAYAGTLTAFDVRLRLMEIQYC